MEKIKLYEEYIENTYEELTKLSQNTSGSTFLARNRQNGMLVVKKQVSLEVATIYKKLQNIISPNLVPILDICYLENYCIVVERYISGETLEQRLERKGKFMEDEAIYYSLQILKCLQLVHKMGVVHRDLTPANILISVDGIVKILDFGIARMQKENQEKDTVIMGTVGYASPEQFGFQQTDERADIYAFGILLNEMLTGVKPNEELPEKMQMRKIVKKCTIFEPNGRYISTGEVLKEFGMKDTGENIWETDRCIIPGFRRNIFWHKMVAVVVYFYCFIGFCGILLSQTVNISSFLVNFVAMFLFWVVPIMVVTNFGRWENRLRFYAKLPLAIRIIIRIILMLVFMVLGILLNEYITTKYVC